MLPLWRVSNATILQPVLVVSIDTRPTTVPPMLPCLVRRPKRARRPPNQPIKLLFQGTLVNKAEDVLLHRRILAECADPDNRPVFHA
ncbi:Serine/threonine-protein kinase HT1 [Hordeum vulgare]|nr:Serine/threonine-protein kinase HT1 [Hordeum vulgare]